MLEKNNIMIIKTILSIFLVLGVGFSATPVFADNIQPKNNIEQGNKKLSKQGNKKISKQGNKKGKNNKMKNNLNRVKEQTNEQIENKKNSAGKKRKNVKK